MFNLKSDRAIRDLRIGMSVGILGLGLALVGSGCGSAPPASQIVTNVQVKTFVKDSEDWIQASATLNTGGFQVAGINIPVTNPNTHVVYGQVTLVPALCSGGCAGYSADLTIALNLNQASTMPHANPILPNGTPLPVGGLQNAQTVAIPIAETGAIIYFSFGPGVAMLGTAIPFSALDPAGQYVPGINVFQPIQAGPVNLIAGIFAGAAPKTTGIGLFIDLSGVMNQKPTSLHAMIASTRGGQIHSVLDMRGTHPSSSKVNKLYRRIYELSQDGLVLDMRK